MTAAPVLVPAVPPTAAGDVARPRPLGCGRGRAGLTWPGAARAGIHRRRLRPGDVVEHGPLFGRPLPDVEWFARAWEASAFHALELLPRSTP